MNPVKIIRYSCVLVLALMLFPLATYAQEQASIVGTATDSAGALLPGVPITITNEATNQIRAIVSNSAGYYSVPSLGIGTYTVKADLQGFKGFIKTGISLNVNDVVRVDIQLAPGSVSQNVTVTANTMQVQSDTNEISTLISGKQISQLDINGRNIAGLATISPGVTTTNADFLLPVAGAGMNLSFGGMNPANNIWLIDGNEALDRGSGGDIDIAPSPDAIAEFKELTSNYGADFGFGSGGTVTLVLKSGTSRFHGALWEYVRNNALDANNYFSNLSKTTPPELRFNTFGGNIGGPVFIPGHRNNSPAKTFFFINEEWRSIIQGAVLNHPVPSADERMGDFSALSKAIYVPTQVGDPVKLAQFASLGLVPGQPFPGNKIPVSLLDPNVQLFLSTGALPQATSGGNYIASANSTINLHEDIVRIDHSVNDKVSLMGHFLRDGYSAVIPGSSLGGSFPTINFPEWHPGYNAVIKMTYIIRPSLVNEAAFNYNGSGIYYGIGGSYKQPSGWNVSKFFPGNDPNDRLPAISIGAPYSVNWTPLYLPYNSVATEYGERDDLSWTKGSHNLKFGGSFIHYTKNQIISSYTEGEYSFGGGYTAEYGPSGQTLASGNSFADMLLGLTTNYTESELQDRRHFRQNFGAAYLTDNWRVHDTVTLNLGVRYEALPHSYEKYGQLSNFVPSDYNPANKAIYNSAGDINVNSPGVMTVPGVPLSNVLFYMNGMQLAGRNGVPLGLVKNYWGTVEPRVGFAYDVYGTGKTILRGGSGIFFNQIEGQDLYNAALNPPFSNTPSVGSVYFSNPGMSTLNGQEIGTFPILPNNVSSLALNYHIPETAMWSLGIQQQLNAISTFSIGYVGNASWHQFMERSINTVPLNDPNRLAFANGTLSNRNDVMYPGYGGITQQETTGNANYNGLQTSLRIVNHSGMSLQLAYTWSHAMNIQTVGTGLTSSTLSNPYDARYDYGSSDYDQRNVFIADYIYPIPLFHGWTNAFARQALGGWQLSGITYMKSGLPTTPTLGFDNLGIGAGTDRPNLVRPLSYPRTRLQWFNTSAYQAPAPLAFGNAARNSIRMPGRDEWNLGLFKTVLLNRENGIALQFRVDAYNAFNHTQFETVSSGFNSSNFGQVTAAWDPRVFQLSMRLGF